jgi:hypothetical protein
LQELVASRASADSNDIDSVGASPSGQTLDDDFRQLFAGGEDLSRPLF